ncbi:MAG: hypothetical protein KME35_12565 [Aphanocapsa sp. GSE-SYN-MK-11-07L]|jgi:hypothetical protein|nr:hypothetical protein [Aphanocapsa sp. GSE-SYN-MK-11-07L]
MKTSILTLSAILAVAVGSYPASAQVAPATEIIPTPETLPPTGTTPFANSASIGTIEVSPEVKSEFQAPQQLPVTAITLPEDQSPSIFDRLFTSLGLPSSPSAPEVEPGKFDAGPNKGVNFLRTDI